MFIVIDIPITKLLTLQLSTQKKRNKGHSLFIYLKRATLTYRPFLEPSKSNLRAIAKKKQAVVGLLLEPKK
jgi:hypothetical protein